MMYDVVPMQAGHILLGRPWQYDRRVTHDGYRNKYSFVKKGRNITLVPLSPKQVFEDQLRMVREKEQKEKNEKEKKSERKKRVKKKERRVEKY